MAQYPAYTSAPKIGNAILTTGVTTLTVSGTTGLTKILDAGTAGTRINRVVAKATNTVANGLIAIWAFSGSGNAFLVDHLPVVATTPSGTVASARVEKSYNDFYIPNGWSLWASTFNSENWNVTGYAGDI